GRLAAPPGWGRGGPCHSPLSSTVADPKLRRERPGLRRSLRLAGLLGRLGPRPAEAVRAQVQAHGWNVRPGFALRAFRDTPDRLRRRRARPYCAEFNYAPPPGNRSNEAWVRIQSFAMFRHC